MYRNISAANVEFLGLDQLHPVGKNRRAIAAALAARRLGGEMPRHGGAVSMNGQKIGIEKEKENTK